MFEYDHGTQQCIFYPHLGLKKTYFFQVTYADTSDPPADVAVYVLQVKIKFSQMPVSLYLASFLSNVSLSAQHPKKTSSSTTNSTPRT